MHCPAQGEGVIWSEDGVAVDGELEVGWTELGEEAAGERDEAYVPSSTAKGKRPQKASSSRVMGKGSGKRRRTEDQLESDDQTDDDGDDDNQEGDSELHSKSTRRSSKAGRSRSPVKKVVKGGKRASPPSCLANPRVHTAALTLRLLLLQSPSRVKLRRRPASRPMRRKMTTTRARSTRTPDQRAWPACASTLLCRPRWTS